MTPAASPPRAERDSSPLARARRAVLPVVVAAEQAKAGRPADEMRVVLRYVLNESASAAELVDVLTETNDDWPNDLLMDLLAINAVARVALEEIAARQRGERGDDVPSRLPGLVAIPEVEDWHAHTINRLGENLRNGFMAEDGAA